MRRFHRTLLVSLLLACPESSLRAQAVPDVSGRWEGSIQVPDGAVKFEVDLAKNGKGELAGTFANPSQNLKGLQLSSFAVEGTSLRFQIKGAPGERQFKGILSADGKTMTGEYSQGGYTIPFSMTRTGDARIEPPARSAPIGKELEGTWNATLESNGLQRRLVLDVANQPDGTSSGTVLNVDEGLEIPIGTITQKASSVTLELTSVGGTYAGTLNAEGTELVGTWTQRGAVLPLTFRRAAGTSAKQAGVR